MDTDTIKVGLLTSAYSPNIDSHTIWTDVSGSEVVGTGYTTGGATLANVSVTQDNTNDRAVLDADDTAWASSTITARYAVVYDSTPVSPAKPLIAVFDFGSDKSTTANTFTLQWNATGMWILT